VCGEGLDVEVFLSNPLQVPMLVQHMSLSTSGVPFEAFTASLTLPPGRSKGERIQQHCYTAQRPHLRAHCVC